MKDIVTEDLLTKLAELSKIDISPEETKEMIPDLEKILDYFNEMSNLDSSVSRSKSAMMSRDYDVLREDTDKVSFIKETACEQFPDSHEGFLRIPGVFGDK